MGVTAEKAYEKHMHQIFEVTSTRMHPNILHLVTATLHSKVQKAVLSDA